MKVHIRIKLTIYLSILVVLLSSCDNINPKKSFKLAVPEFDHTYYKSGKHLKSFLEKGGFKIEIIKTTDIIEANQLVAEGKADLTFIMNHSDFIPSKIGSDAGKLRTITPLFERLFFLFSKSPLDNKHYSARELLEKREIGIEVLNGETHHNLKKLLSLGKIDNVSIVNNDLLPEYIHFWGTYYGPRATQLIENGWEEVSLSTSWVNFITLNESALKPFVLPAIPGVEDSDDINTFAVQTCLIGNRDLGDKAIFNLSSYIFQHKLELVAFDLMYRSISESVDQSTLLYPLHVGTDSYFRRAQPSFFEKYAELMAYLFSIGAVLFGMLQALKNRISSKKKERIDNYFLEYLDIRNEKSDVLEKKEMLESLLQKALIQMTSEKLDKLDFYIFSRMVQQELATYRTE